LLSADTRFAGTWKRSKDVKHTERKIEATLLQKLAAGHKKISQLPIENR
jgi:hypothetical protein